MIKWMIAGAAALLNLCSPAVSSVRVELKDVMFDDNTALTGYFIASDAFDQVLSFDIETQTGTYTGMTTSIPVAADYNPTDAVASILDAKYVEIDAEPSFPGQVSIYLNVDQPFAPDTTYDVTGSQDVRYGTRAITSGFLVSGPQIEASAVPEASTWLMMIAGLGIAGAAHRQRRRSEVRTLR